MTAATHMPTLLLINLMMLALSADYQHKSKWNTWGCPNAYEKILNSEHCYRAHRRQTHFDSAKSVCKKEGGDLVEIEDKRENNAVANFLERKKIRWSWLGYRRGDKPDIYQFSLTM